MHELQVTKSILDIVLRHAITNNVTKIMTINLSVGELSDLENEWIQHYFDYLAKDTLAEGAKLQIERIPVVLKCEECSHSFQVNMKEEKDIRCPECQSKSTTLISGKDYYIKDMEAM